jgi:hypothetical protein
MKSALFCQFASLSPCVPVHPSIYLWWVVLVMLMTMEYERIGMLRMHAGHRIFTETGSHMIQVEWHEFERGIRWRM